MKLQFLLIAAISLTAFAQDCPHGDGDYCGSYVQKTSNYLYTCTAGSWVMKEVCDHGCFVASAGNPDVCVSSPEGSNYTDLYGDIDPNSKTCPQGNERNYCGGLIGKLPSTLYECHGEGEWSLVENCTAGCKATPTGYDDYCVATTDCADGDRMYCGSAIGKDLHHLYECSGGVYTDKGTCPNGCFITTNGENDYCLTQNDVVPGFFINAYTVQMIKSHEGFHKSLYQDEVEPQYQSIGYGHLCKPTVAESDCNNLQTNLTPKDATIILSQDIKPFESCICSYVSVKLNGTDVKLNANQYGVLVALAFERGDDDCQYFRVSQLRTSVNGGRFDDVPGEFLSYAGNSSQAASRHQDFVDAWVMKSNEDLTCPPSV